MKHLLTLTALLISSLAMGQMPYNPDSNGDDLIGATDLISVLGLYNTLMVDSSLTCDYQGTDLEQLCIGLIDATLQLDSLYIEYLIYDTLSYYLPGCPDLVLEPVILEPAYMLPSGFHSQDPVETWVQTSMSYLNYSRSVRLSYWENNNNFSLYIRDDEFTYTTTYNLTSDWDPCAPFSQNCGNRRGLPFPEDWILSEDGIHVDFKPHSWANNCENLRIIPYWSEAE